MTRGRRGLLPSLLVLGACASATPPGPVPPVVPSPAPTSDHAPGASGSSVPETGETRDFIEGPLDGTPPAPDWSSVFVSLSVLLQTRDHRQYFVPTDATLHTNEAIAIELGVAQAEYVYLVQVHPDGQASLLYPSPSDPPQLQPGEFHRIPRDRDRGLRVVGAPGVEELVLIASRDSLGDGEPLMTAIRKLRDSGTWAAASPSPSPSHPPPAPRPRPPPAPAPRLLPDPKAGPPVADGLTRGDVLPTGSSGRALDVRADASGVAVALFRFKHDP